MYIYIYIVMVNVSTARTFMREALPPLLVCSSIIHLLWATGRTEYVVIIDAYIQKEYIYIYIYIYTKCVELQSM